MAALFSSKCKLNECIEKAFFRTIILIALIGCVAVTIFDLTMFGKLTTSVHLTALAILVLLSILYSVNKIPFGLITRFGLLLLTILFTYRGLTTHEFNEVTYTLLITIGFVNSLVSRQLTARVLTILIFACLIIMLFKDNDSLSTVKVIRRAIPYISVFFIVTVCSAFLKQKYEDNQVRLREMVELLNQKNRRINEQNALLQRKFKQLEELNQNLESIIEQKTTKITEKNKQLAEIVYTNAHTIRGPLARILGLLNLSNIDLVNKDFYILKVHKEATDMDEILLHVTKQIENNLQK